MTADKYKKPPEKIEPIKLVFGWPNELLEYRETSPRVFFKREPVVVARKGQKVLHDDACIDIEPIPFGEPEYTVNVDPEDFRDK